MARRPRCVFKQLLEGATLDAIAVDNMSLDQLAGEVLAKGSINNVAFRRKLIMPGLLDGDLEHTSAVFVNRLASRTSRLWLRHHVSCGHRHSPRFCRLTLSSPHMFIMDENGGFVGIYPKRNFATCVEHRLGLACGVI
jgi:hypothetical protein